MASSEGVVTKSDSAHAFGGMNPDARYSASRLAALGLACSFPARIVSPNREISTMGRIVSGSRDDARVEVMFPSKGPSAIMLFHGQNDEIYECEVRWRTDAFIGVRFLDILGPRRRRLFFADQPVPLRWRPNEIIRLNVPPRDDGFLNWAYPLWRTGAGEPPSSRSAHTPGPVSPPAWRRSTLSEALL